MKRVKLLEKDVDEKLDLEQYNIFSRKNNPFYNSALQDMFGP